MEPEVLFEEQQYFDRGKPHGFLKILLGVLLLAYLILLLLVKDQRKEISLFFLIIFVVLVAIFFAIPARLITQVRSDGISIRFPPFAGSSRFYSWENISEIYMREYNPIKEYYGWGIRVGPSGYAYSVRGTIGLQLVLKNKSRVLIGTARPDELNDILKKINRQL